MIAEISIDLVHSAAFFGCNFTANRSFRSPARFRCKDTNCNGYDRHIEKHGFFTIIKNMR